MADPLADVIHQAYTEVYPTLHAGETDLNAHVTAVVRAHIAAVLDAEERRWSRMQSAVDAIGTVRATLLGTEDPTTSPYQAVEMVAAAVEDRRVLEAEVERLRAALTDALEGLVDMHPYVPQYFRDKWKHADYITRAREALEGPK